MLGQFLVKPWRATAPSGSGRARRGSLAVVYLTRRKDLIMTEEAADVSMDLWVTLNVEEKKGHRKFGVKLGGVRTAVTADPANESSTRVCRE